MNTILRNCSYAVLLNILFASSSYSLIWSMEKYAFTIDQYGVTWEVFSRYQNRWVQVLRVNKQVSDYMQIFINNRISANPQFSPSYYNGYPVYAKYRQVRFLPYE